MTNILQGFENSKRQPPEKISEPVHATNIHERFVSYMTSGQFRAGQAWMNALWFTDPELYNRITNTEADCFYDDKKIDAFKAVVFGKE